MSANIIIVGVQDDPFARISKKLLADKNLSWKAKGILCYLLGKPPQWKVRVSDLVNQSPEGERAVRSGLNELRDAGYAKFERAVDGGVFKEGVWKISDSPLFSPRCCFAHVDNSHLSKNDSSKNKSKKSKESSFSKRRLCEEASKNKPEAIKSKWKPDTRSQQEKLNSLDAPDDFPSQAEFEQFIESDTPSIWNFRPNLYVEFCQNKWHVWNAKSIRWQKIGDWRTLVKGLEEKIEDSIKRI